MAVNNSALSSDLQDLYSDMDGSPMSLSDLADRMAQIISKQIKTAGVPAGAVLVEADGGVPNAAEIKVV